MKHPDDNPDPDKKYDQWKDENGPHGDDEKADNEREDKILFGQEKLNDSYLKYKKE